MNKRNYQKELEQIIEKLPGEQKVPRLLLHSCCAPCSSYVLEYLSQQFDITVFYYNPNIFPEEEYRKRVIEQQRLISEMDFVHPVSFLEGPYEPEKFLEIAKGLEQVPEGGERCFRCFRLRLLEAVCMARAGKFDYVTTTLTISPLKNAEKLNSIGEELAREYQVNWLPGDFKKKNGYKRSVELSEQHHLYRQNFCGCVFSKREALEREKQSSGEGTNSDKAKS